MSSIIASLIFVLAGQSSGDASLLNARCVLKKPTYFFVAPSSGKPAKTLPTGTQLTLGMAKGKRIAVSLVGQTTKGYIPLKWSKKACALKPASQGTQTEGEATEGEATEGEAAESEATESEATEGEATESETTESEATEGEATESETTESEATESEATESEATESEATESEATESEATESEATESEATEVALDEKAAEASGAEEKVDIQTQNDDAALGEDSPTNSETDATTEVKEEASETEQPELSVPAVDGATKEMTVEAPEEGGEASDVVKPEPPSAASSTKSDSKMEALGDADAEEPSASNLEDSSPTVLNVPKLPNVVRAEPKIFEPLIGRDKVKRIVVLDTRIDDALNEPLDGGGMGALIASELQNLSGGLFDVVARADLMALVTRLEQAQLMGCADESCMTDIGALAEADFLIASSVTPAGDGRLLTVELLDALSGQAMRREAVTWEGDTKGLVELCAPQTARLVDAERGQSYSGAIQLVATEDGAEVYVDEQLAGKTPIDIFANLDIGSHKLTVKKSGYNLFEIPVVVGRNQTSLVQAELIRPWYNEWWVWTAAGAVLTTAVLSFALSGDDVVRQQDLPDTVIGVDTSVDTGTGR